MRKVLIFLNIAFSLADPGVIPNNELQNSKPEIVNDDSIISMEVKSPSDQCQVIQIITPCHECSQHDFQLNVDECHATKFIEKVKCKPGEDNLEKTKTLSCQPSKSQPESIWPFWFLSFTSGTFFWIASRRRQRILDDRRNRKLTQQLQSL